MREQPEISSLGHARNVFLDLTPLRQSPAFARMWAGTTISGIGSSLTVVAVNLEVFHITNSTFMVSMVSLFSLVPAIVLGLYGGVLVDAFDRRTVALVAAITAWISTAVIAGHAWLGGESIWVLYVFSAVNAVAYSVMSTSRTAIIPRLLPKQLIPAASAFSGLTMGLVVTVGPALAGLLVATVGFPWTYTLDVALFCAAFIGLATLPSMPPVGEVVHAGIRSVLDGLAYLREAPNVRMGFLLDITAMTFGSPRVLCPAIGAVVFGGGPITAGWLLAAPAVGTLVCSLLSGPIRRIDHHGRAVALAVWAYGAAILGFGIVVTVTMATGAAVGAVPTAGSEKLATPLPFALALVFLALSGAADNVSMIFRNSIALTAVPDRMRGRMQGIYIVVVTGGPRIGDLYAGVLASLAALWVPPLAGGLVIAVMVGVLLRLNPRFWHYDGRDPQP